MKVTLDFDSYRTDPELTSWNLPLWGHPVSLGTLPLFMRVGDRLRGIGTAFWVGGNVPFVMTALHNILEALRHEPAFERQHATGDLPQKIDLSATGFYVLHPDEITSSNGRFTLLPLETVDAGPPSDVVFGYPQFEPGRQRLCPPLSFDPPRIGETVLSIGYTDFEPVDGIPMSALRGEGGFDWARDYRHRLVVTEGRVKQIFTRRFSKAFVGGPCFTFDSAIAHGQSGGPVMTLDGRIVGINSAGASHFFDRDMSIASMLFPLLLTPLRAGVQHGPLRLNFKTRLFDMIARGGIDTDGSELNVGIMNTPEGMAVGPRTYKEDRAHIFEDFSGYQDNRPPREFEGDIYG